ncbi:MAG: hypothetical protein FWF41_01640 [Betaproteobacteria bacterium]|nr:hypothetical protein [Betaproteobacteria bacterium]
MKTILMLFAFCLSSLCAAALPQTVFSINTVTIGKTTLDNIRKIYGEANEVSTCWHADADCKGICYVYSKNFQSAYLIFETSPFVSETIDREFAPGELAIYNYRLSLINPQIECAPTQIDLFSLETGNGFKLGQSSAKFKKKAPVNFKKKRETLTNFYAKKVIPEETTAYGAKFYYKSASVDAQFKSDKLMEILVASTISDDVCDDACQNEQEKPYPPKAVYSINTITVGKSGFDDIRAIYGNTNSADLPAHGGAGICYIYEKESEQAYLTFESYWNAEKEKRAIIGYRLSLGNSLNPGIECSPTQIDLFTLETGNGFKLGQSMAKFKKKGVVKFEKEKDTLKYDKEVSHDGDWPPVRKEPMYESHVIKAQFKSNKLVDLHVTKIVDN